MSETPDAENLQFDRVYNRSGGDVGGFDNLNPDDDRYINQEN